MSAKMSDPSHDASAAAPSGGAAAVASNAVYGGGPRVSDPNAFAVGSQGAASVRVSLYNDQLRILCNVS